MRRLVQSLRHMQAGSQQIFMLLISSSASHEGKPLAALINATARAKNPCTKGSYSYTQTSRGRINPASTLSKLSQGMPRVIFMVTPGDWNICLVTGHRAGLRK